jgi:hypothetical protein
MSASGIRKQSAAMSILERLKKYQSIGAANFILGAGKIALRYGLHLVYRFDRWHIFAVYEMRLYKQVVTSVVTLRSGRNLV